MAKEDQADTVSVAVGGTTKKALPLCVACDTRMLLHVPDNSVICQNYDCALWLVPIHDWEGDDDAD